MFRNLGPKAYLIIIILILGAAFLSQQPYAIEYGKNLYLQAEARASGWAGSFFAKKQAGELAGGEGLQTNAANNQNQNNIFENSFLKK